MPPARRIRRPKTKSRSASRDTAGAIELLTEVLETLKGSRRLFNAKVPSTWRSGDLEILTDMWIVRRGGTAVPVTPKEFHLLCILVAANGAPVPREVLWSGSADNIPSSSRSLDAHIWSLRRKLEADPADPKHLITLVRHGYRLE